MQHPVTAPPPTHPDRARRIGLVGTALLLLGLHAAGAIAGPDRSSEFTNLDITNSRHNLSQRDGATDLLAGGPNSGGAAQMDSSRNNYGEVCVYCHTPHGANTASGIAGAPLWNRTYLAGPTPETYYTLYTSPTLTTAATRPGVNSLTCLTCHDGTVGIDSIINMPGSGRYNAAQMTSQDDTWLTNTWPGGAAVHDGLNTSECLACHNPTAPGFAATATDFTAFYIGTDLSNDHPVGIPQPAVSRTDFNATTATVGSTTFYDLDTDTRPDPGEIRFYSGMVECASCHDPHGVPNPADSNKFYPTFLRASNSGSNVCLTCHVK